MNIKHSTQLIFSLFLFLSFIRCTSYPDSIDELGERIFISLKKNDFSRIWRVHSNNPKAYKRILIRQYREQKISKVVYQKEMGRIVYLENQSRKRLIEDFQRIVNYIKAIRVELVKQRIEKRDMNASYFVYRIGEEDRAIRINVHFLVSGGKFYVVSLYSIA
mgnify:CR=1 FL=1